ncbi:hypothetical protein NDU88_006140 [Pleurodeles waltl]|uniref:Uncharacterized protein n=1 Tax=Pleurodeles waltl TaxID=8319 RepID=A0AAV7RQC8_PLEWA|nr:hypothetical protein NDU88_006140 [Pleurodeles waltl]
MTGARVLDLPGVGGVARGTQRGRGAVAPALGPLCLAGAASPRPCVDRAWPAPKESEEIVWCFARRPGRGGPACHDPGAWAALGPGAPNLALIREQGDSGAYRYPLAALGHRGRTG